MKDIVAYIRLEEEKGLLAFIERRVNAPLIQQLLSIKDRGSDNSGLSAYLKGNNLPLSDKVGRDLFRLCNNVQKSLGLTGLKIEYLISKSRDINAAAFFNVNYGDKNPHFIILNSGLLELLEEPELAFVVGHELGHLIYEHTNLKRVVQFIYPEFDRLPYLLRGLYELWGKLGEISADRAGLLAIKRLEPAVMAMFKLSSGLGARHLKVAYADIVDMTDKLLAEASGLSSHQFETHPSNPVRVKALRLFYESSSWRQIISGKPLSSDPELNSGIDGLVSLLKRCPCCDIDRAELEFLAAAGFMLIASDGKAEEEEFDHLNNLLSQYLYMPQGFIQTLAKQDEAYEALHRSALYILEHYPHRTRDLFSSLLPLVMRDRKLNDLEVELALKIAVDELKIPPGEAVDLMLKGISDLYTPLA